MGRLRTHRHAQPVDGGSKGRWFKSSRPDISRTPICLSVLLVQFGNRLASYSMPWDPEH